MTYRVVYTDAFIADVDSHVAYLLGEKVPAATIEQWFDKLFDLVDSLNEWPLRFPVEDLQTQATGQETRKLNVGDYLVFYQIDDDHRQINVVAFMHGARRRGARPGARPGAKHG
ncbi:MAG: type II toxin-antitoxin system RelE/ParE family toxin [Phycisphaeraceae bacterium]